jgi:hypothetical protein
MSSLIEYKKYVLTTGRHPLLEYPLVFCFSELSHSNITTTDGRPLKRLKLRMVELDNQFIKAVVGNSIACENGSLKMNGRHVKPETFIAAWRRAHTQAISVDRYLKNADLQIDFHSFQNQLTDLEAKHPVMSQPDRRHEIEQLREKLIAHDSIMEGIDDPDVLATPFTRFMITQDNKDELFEILSSCLKMGISGRSIIASSFSLYAYRMGAASNNRDIKPVVGQHY